VLGRLAERLAGRKIYRARDLPWGFDFATDAGRRAAQVAFSTVFDVGANVGQSTLAFASLYPAATIWAFEPFDEAFRELQFATRHVNACCFKLALAAQPGTVNVELAAKSVNNSLLRTADSPAGETVQVATLDGFAAEHQISRIDFLKVDTEGFDLEVLKGAERLLCSAAITFVQVEAGMNRHNTKHVPFEQLKDHLEQRGYTLFGLYEQTPEWSGEARLRFANAIFLLASAPHPVAAASPAVRSSAQAAER
jgi:FkbM family methyltransferase